VAVAADGTYSFSGLAHNTSYTVQISTIEGTVGDFAPTTLLPPDWVATGENIGLTAGDDSSPDSILEVVIASADVTNANFGIERAPQAFDVTALSQLNPGGTTQVAVPALDGSDPEDPSVTTFVILTLPADGTLYYNGTAVTAGQRISSYNPSLLTLDPDNGTVTVTFTYLAEDAAGVASAPATVSMPFTPLSISGNVFDDTNALTDNTINGTGTDAGGNLYVLLISNGLISDNALVAADGTYSFNTVAPNTTYSVILSTAPGVLGDPEPSASLPSGWRSIGEHLGTGLGSDGAVNGTLSVPVVTSNVANANLGLEQVGTLTGHLYHDDNGNFTQDGSEADLINVDVIITDHNGIAQTVASDANGNWSAIVSAGSASVHVDNTDTDFPAGVTQTEGTEPTNATVVFNASASAGNDGYFLPATITGHLYIDSNGNGAQDVGEPDLADVDVSITDSNGDPHTAATDSNGDWTALVPPGVTIATIDQLDTDFTSAVAVGFTQTEGTDPSIFIAVAGTSTDGGIDGYFIPGTVSGHLYLDTNGNGTQEVGEPNLPNVGVIVTDSNGTDQTVITNFNGDWTASVPPGSTSETVDPNNANFMLNVPAGYLQTDGSDPTVVTAVANADVSAGNDGYFIPAIINGHLYIDTNGNGTQEVGEPNLASVDFVITDSNGVQQTVSSNASGNWTASVPPGTTTAGVDESDTDFPAGATQTQGTNPYVFNAVANANTLASNNGYYIAALVSGHLYMDTNGNGIQDGIEPNLPNIDVTVTDSAGAIQTVTTNSLGDWSAIVPPGSTTAKVDTAGVSFTNSVPAGYVQTEGTDPTTVMAVGNVDTSAGNDGYFIPAILTGHLYVDSNGNGTQDGSEPNLVNVDVVITDSNGDPQTVSSNTNGNWTASVPPGSTTAKVTTTDLDFTAVFASGFTQTEGDDPTTVVAVANATTPGGIDGFQPSSLYSIGGQVRFDSDRNGSFLDADKPLGNFTIKVYADTNGNGVYDPGTDTLLDTQVTGNDGIYKFTGYPNGNYVLVESPPNAGVQKTNDKDGNNDRSIPVTLAGAGSNGNDFLEFADPQGWFYDTETGAVIPGGSIIITSVPAGGATNIILDGSNG
ncbi:MAG: hypothetical protein JWO89_3766, partial [Verrucomicrobiaceae bacterium]|nr:hypothetical protein [Verrucomicrobiaceae bacterium]